MRPRCIVSACVLALAFVALSCGRSSDDDDPRECTDEERFEPTGEGTWYSLGDSAFADRTTRVVWGSGSGSGILPQMGVLSYRIVATPAGAPIVGWTSDAWPAEYRVARWESGAWRSLPPIATSYVADLASDPDGNPVVAGEAVSWWQGDEWETLALDARGGSPAVAFTDSGGLTSVGIDWIDGDDMVAYYEWTGTAWTEPEVVTTAYLDAHRTDLGYDDEGRPLVRYGGGLYRREGTVWRMVANADSNAPFGFGKRTVAHIECAGEELRVFVKSLDEPPDSWTPLPPLTRDAGEDCLAGVLFDGEDRLYVTRRTAERWDGSSWDSVGDLTAGPDSDSSNPLATDYAFAINARGDLLRGRRRAWAAQEINSHSVYVVKWDGTCWTEYNGKTGPQGISDTEGYSTAPRLAAGPVKTSAVWFDADPAPGTVRAREWDGMAWHDLGESAVVGSGSGAGPAVVGAHVASPTVTLDGDERPVVSWWAYSRTDDSTGPPTDWYYLYLKRWDGTSWIELDGSGSGFGLQEVPGPQPPATVVVDAAGRIVVGPGLNEWDGSVWQRLPAAGMGCSGNSLRLDPAGDLVMACAESGAWHVERWNGTDWELDAVGSGADITVQAGNVILGFDASRAPIIAWAQDRDPSRPGDRIYQLYLATWDGSAWVGLGRSNDGTGISSAPEGIIGHDMVVDSEGHPIVAWSDNASGAYEVRVVHWTGTEWEELAGSLGGGAVSNSDGMSMQPALSLYGQELCVAWAEPGKTSFQTVARCHLVH